MSIVAAARISDVLLQGLQLVKCLASTQGPKVRVNAILPGLLLTEWVGLHVRSCLLWTDVHLGRQFHTGEASGVKGQSLPKEGSGFGNTYCEVFYKLMLEQTDLEDCADAFVAAARNSSLTGQNIQIGEYLSASC